MNDHEVQEEGEKNARSVRRKIKIKLKDGREMRNG